MDITAIIDAFQSGTDSLSMITDSLNVIHDAVASADAQANADALKSLGAFIGAGIAMIGATGVGAGQGYAAGAAALAVSRNPEVKSQIMSTMIVGMAIAESASIYSLIIAILLIFVANTL